MSDVAILHDQFSTFGGAERVAIQIAREFDAPIYVVTGRHPNVPDDIEIKEIGGGIGKRLSRVHYHFEDIYNMLAWQYVQELYDYDTIIQTKTNPQWFIPQDDQTVVRYLHSTPRNLYDQHHRRGGNLLSDTLKIVQRMLYRQTVPYADQWIVNSELVQRRLGLYWNQDATVVHPPVDTNAATPRPADTDEPYLAVVGRLATNKRVPLLRKVSDRVDIDVMVAGEGPHADDLQPMPSNLYHMGYVDERDKWDLLAGATGVLYLAENEDFGMVPIEAWASGTPVIGVSEGFTKYQITDGVNGYLVGANPTPEDVETGIRRLLSNGVDMDYQELAAIADQFNPQRFRQEMRDVVDRAERDSQIEVAFDGV